MRRYTQKVMSDIEMRRYSQKRWCHSPKIFCGQSWFLLKTHVNFWSVFRKIYFLGSLRLSGFLLNYSLFWLFLPYNDGLNISELHNILQTFQTLIIQKNCFIFFNESPLKMMKNAFYFILKACFVPEIFKFLSWIFGHVQKTAWLEW